MRRSGGSHYRKTKLREATGIKEKMRTRIPVKQGAYSQNCRNICNFNQKFVLRRTETHPGTLRVCRGEKLRERSKWETEPQSAEIDRETDSNFSGLWIILKAAEILKKCSRNRENK